MVWLLEHLFIPHLPFADNTQLNAQVPAAVSPGAGERHRPAAVRHLQDVRVQGDAVHRRHRLPEREDNPTQDRPQPLRQRLPGDGAREMSEEVRERKPSHPDRATRHPIFGAGGPSVF